MNMPEFSYKEFKAYLLLYVANADCEISQEEKDLILSKVTEEQFNKVHSRFRENIGRGHIDIILSYRSYYYPNEEQVKKLLAEVVKLIVSDSKITLEEKYCHQLLLDVLNS